LKPNPSAASAESLELECDPSCETFRCPPAPNEPADPRWGASRVNHYCAEPFDSAPETKCAPTVATVGSDE
jgi:hypothetical protein